MTDLTCADMSKLELYVESLLLRDGPDPRKSTLPSLTEQVSGSANSAPLAGPVDNNEEMAHEDVQHRIPSGLQQNRQV